MQGYELPEEITDIEEAGLVDWIPRAIGMYISGVRRAQDIIKDLKPTTKARYLQKAKELGQRKRGRPVDTIAKLEGYHHERRNRQWVTSLAMVSTGRPRLR